MLTLAVILLASEACAIPLTRRSPNGPVISSNFQDPAVLKVDGTYHAYAGPNGNPPINVLTATSTDFSNWSVDGTDALPNTGPWTASVPHLWAPDVVRLDNGLYVLYYSAVTSQDESKHCVGAGTSSSPTGPFTPLDAPLYCDLSIGGAIDAEGYKDPQTGLQYIIYKVDGNSIGSGGSCNNGIEPIVSTPIVLQQVSPDDGTTPTGDPLTLLTNEPSDGPTIEAPTLTFNSATGLYYLFFASGCFSDPGYNIQYATAPAVTGPYTRRGIFLQSGDTAANLYLPGGPDIDTTTGNMVFHGDTNLGWFQGDGSERVRAMYAATLEYGSDGTVALGSLV